MFCKKHPEKKVSHVIQNTSISSEHTEHQLEIPPFLNFLHKELKIFSQESEHRLRKDGAE